MLALGIWQGLLDAIGWVLARIYDVVPNYGLSIILLTLGIRLLLFPLGVKQIKSMQHMQALQPKLKELQKKYKSNKQKLQEEQMKLYKEAGVNPLGGCLPLLLQFPILIAMYSVIRPIPVVPAPNPPPTAPGAFQVVNNHLPEDSALFHTIVTHTNADFLWMDLQCSLMNAGTQVPQQYKDPQTGDTKTIPNGREILSEDGTFVIQDATTISTLNCGNSRFPDAIPYVLLLIVMVGSTFYQQVQMQRASPPGSQSSQQQTIMRLMPLMFAFWGLTFPAGLVLYWTMSNLFQVGQQTFLLRAGHIGPDALEKRLEEQRARANTTPEKTGFMSRWMAKAESAAKQREELQKNKQPPPKTTKKPPSSNGKPSKPAPKPAPKQNPAKPTRGPKPGNQLGKPSEDA